LPSLLTNLSGALNDFFSQIPDVANEKVPFRKVVPSDAESISFKFAKPNKLKAGSSESNITDPGARK